MGAKSVQGLHPLTALRVERAICSCRMKAAYQPARPGTSKYSGSAGSVMSHARPATALKR